MLFDDTLLFSGYWVIVRVYLICSEFGIVPGKPVAHKRYYSSSNRRCFHKIYLGYCKVQDLKNVLYFLFLFCPPMYNLEIDDNKTYVNLCFQFM